MKDTKFIIFPLCVSSYPVYKNMMAKVLAVVSLNFWLTCST